LLLETPAGQGTEVLTRMKDMISFYNRFTKEEKKKFKICIDTCHVFAAGEDPLDYIRDWCEIMGTKALALIHFNDSKDAKGSCKDRHARIGSGKIGLNRLTSVMKYAVDNNIDLVVE
jgi:deoxyribonuclease IV